ncbi:MAG: Na/Pi cotransporter family protein [Bacilli bacterium]|nr:Na/Pi cotransporter family protein [Mollicutes bacterium]MDY3899144.1 Na/Pi cotransporter family protein [Bacilli bacterium]
MSSFQILMYAFGGMAIFLYGIYIMGDALKGLAGNRLRTIIEKSTNKVWKGILVGFVLTAIIQSSSGLTAIVISLIAAGLMTLPQAIPVIMGANIGTTVTSILVGFDIGGISLIFVTIGVIIVFFIKQKKIHYMGLTILGFGLLFFGLDTMDLGLKEIVNNPSFTDIVKTLDNPALGILAGVVLTAVVQSSSALIAIAQQIYATPLASGAHSISLIATISIIIGSNIGTTVTALLSSLSSSRNAKRAALAHLLFNITGCIIFVILLYPFSNLMQMMEDNIPYFTKNPAHVIAVVHIIFNVMTTFVLCWFVRLLVKIVERIIPLTESEKLIKGVDKLEPSLIEQAPVLAIANAKKVTIDMFQIVLQMFDDTKKYINGNDNKLFNRINNLEDVTDNYDNKLHDYLVKVSSSTLSFVAIHEQAICFDTIRDLERIADHLLNLAEFMEERYSNNYIFQDETLNMLNHLLELLTAMINDAYVSFKNNDKKSARRVRATEPQIDELEKKYRKAEVSILTSGVTNILNADLHFVDILANLERIGDHCNNIADNILFESLHDIEDENNIDLNMSK